MISKSNLLILKKKKKWVLSDFRDFLFSYSSFFGINDNSRLAELKKNIELSTQIENSSGDTKSKKQKTVISNIFDFKEFVLLLVLQKTVERDPLKGILSVASAPVQLGFFLV